MLLKEGCLLFNYNCEFVYFSYQLRHFLLLYFEDLLLSANMLQLKQLSSCYLNTIWRSLSFSWFRPLMASLVAQLVRVQSLHWEDPREKGTATHSSILAWKIPWTVWSMGSQTVGHDWVSFSDYKYFNFSPLSPTSQFCILFTILAC